MKRIADIFTKKKRSEIMARIRGKNTSIERQVFALLRRRKIRFRRHHNLPGRPDVALPIKKKAVFIDGDFWHGWKFHEKRAKLPPFWVAKIESNMRRDRRTRAALRRKGWSVLRVWEHDLRKKPLATEARIVGFFEAPNATRR